MNAPHEPTKRIEIIGKRLLREFHIQMHLQYCCIQEEIRTEARGSTYRPGGTRGSDGTDKR